MRFLQWVDLQLTSTGPNAVTVGNVANGGQANLPGPEAFGGVTPWINSAIVDIPGGIPHGRCYAVLEVLRPQAKQAASVVARLWAGYVTRGSVVSLCPFPLTSGLQLRLRFAEGTQGASTDIFYATVGIWDAGLGAAQLFFEPPGNGQGETWAKTPPGPTARGSDPATFTVPANVRWRIHGWGATFVASSTVASRESNVSYQDPTGTEFGGGTASLLVTASTTVTYRGSVGGLSPSPIQGATTPQTPYTISIGLADLYLFPSCVVEVITRGLDTNGSTGDQWSGGRFNIEEWAMLDP